MCLVAECRHTSSCAAQLVQQSWTEALMQLWRVRQERAPVKTLVSIASFFRGVLVLLARGYDTTSAAIIQDHGALSLQTDPNLQSRKPLLAPSAFDTATMLRAQWHGVLQQAVHRTPSFEEFQSIFDATSSIISPAIATTTNVACCLIALGVVYVCVA
jgi:hypothetical protein